MSTLFEISGDIRGNMILNAVRQIVSEARRPTPAEVDAICKDLPGWTECGSDECQAALDMLDELADQHVAALTNEAEMNAAPSAESEPSAHVGEETNTPSIDPAEAQECLRLARIALANARAAVLTATNVRNRCRTRLSELIQQWQTGLPKISREQAAKEAIATFQAVKQANAEAGLPPARKHVPNSYFDRMGAYGHGDATTFLRKQMGRGGKRFGRGDVMTSKGIMRLPSER
jgi:hypothetical protein